jgi:hypothetical protein
MAKAKELKFVSVSADKAGGNTKYIKAKELADKGFKGVVATGVFTGTIPNQYDETPDKSKPNIKIEALEENADGTRDTIILNAGGNLNVRMRNIPVGSIVQVSYLGQEKIKSPDPKKNGKLAHQYDVAVAE